MEIPELKALYLAAQNLREAMESDVALNDFERIAPENYIELLQMTYIEGKIRNFPRPYLRTA